MNSHEKRLIDEVPLLKCGNRTEFKQRLQWLSEGMLKHNLNNGGWPPCPTEIETYRRYKEGTEPASVVTKTICE